MVLHSREHHPVLTEQEQIRDQQQCVGGGGRGSVNGEKFDRGPVVAQRFGGKKRQRRHSDYAVDRI